MVAKVGLTGGIGSGKSTVGKLFKDLGVVVIDADTVARKVTAPGMPALEHIANHFGDQYLHPDGSLNRKALGKQIFHHPEEKKWLEQLLHPLIRKESDEQANFAEGPYCILEIPLLFETQRHLDLDAVIVVHCDQSIRLKRLVEHRGMEKETVMQVFKNQASDNERLQIADYIVNNETSLTALPSQVQNIHQQLVERFN
ncbi:MAG: dephospho-CoA kinase [Acidiferrobacterales bacterium]|nr:dephospho-CoA kinase [Acidiferrobacterales bacterium]